MNQKQWTANDEANLLVNLVQTEPTSQNYQKILNIISGVNNYQPGDLARQGIIKRVFMKEVSRYNNGAGNGYTIEFSDVISVFWENVFKYVGKATVVGEEVNVRTKQDGTNIGESRATKCNPINYLRSIGIMGVRNFINAIYSKSLVQICDDCSNSSRITMLEVSSVICQECKSSNTDKYWPDGTTSYRSKKCMKCNDCGKTWVRKFARGCGECKSKNIRVEHRYGGGADSLIGVHDKGMQSDELYENAEVEAKIMSLLNKAFDTIPTNKNDPNMSSKTRDIYNILFRPESSYDMCSRCTLAAPKKCIDGCNKECDHTKMPDPGVSCGDKSFSMDRCVNYSRKIAEYQDCSASLVARRVKKIRGYIVNWLVNNTGDSTYREILALMKERNLI